MEGNKTLKNDNVVLRVWRFYLEGFRAMTLGKTLWAIILIKLFIMFLSSNSSFSPIS